MKKLLFIAFLCAAAVSCKMAGSLQDSANELLRGDVVAKVGNHKLYRSQLRDYIPTGASAEDSLRLSRQRINAWAEDILLLEMADQQLTKEEKDVSRELEEYRRSLLKYRYEQLYINQRLDTLITEEEVEKYYAQDPERFRLDRPVVKARYLIIPENSRSLKRLKEMISSEDDALVMEADSLAATTAIKYADASDTWIDALTLAQELGTDYGSLMGSLKNRFAQVKDESGILHIAYIVEMIPEGKPAPVEYCAEHIKDLILSERKHRLESGLEQDLLEDARKNNKFVIY